MFARLAVPYACCRLHELGVQLRFLVGCTTLRDHEQGVLPWSHVMLVTWR